MILDSEHKDRVCEILVDMGLDVCRTDQIKKLWDYIEKLLTETAAEAVYEYARDMDERS